MKKTHPHPPHIYVNFILNLICKIETSNRFLIITRLVIAIRIHIQSKFINKSKRATSESNERLKIDVEANRVREIFAIEK